MLSIDTKRRILSIVFQSIKMENPEYIDDIASKITRVTSKLIEEFQKIPSKEEFLRKCSRIPTKFFKHNRINRSEFFESLYEQITDIEIEYSSAVGMHYYDWEKRIKKIGISSNLQKEILSELKSIKQEHTDDVKDIMKILLKLQTKTALAGSELESVKRNLEALILLININEQKKLGFQKRIESWSGSVVLGVFGNLIHDLLKAFGT